MSHISLCGLHTVESSRWGTAPIHTGALNDERRHEEPNGEQPRPSTARGLGVCEWSPEGLYDKSVSWIPNTDEILKLLNKKMN